MFDPTSASKSPLPVQQTQLAFHPHAQATLSAFFFFWLRAAFLRLRNSNGFGRGAPLICSEDPPAIARKCALKSSRRIAASCSRLVGCVMVDSFGCGRRFFWRQRGEDLVEARIAAERVP